LALNQVFSSAFPHHTHPCFDILSAANTLLKHSTICWHPKHVKGHQDDHNDITSLDTWVQLNILIDSKTNDLFRNDPSHPSHYSIPFEAWSVWWQGTKLIQDFFNSLYKIVHAPAAKSYWCRKGQFSSEIFHSVVWKATQDTSKQVSFSKRLFIIEHSTGMCGVGKFMHPWRLSSNPDSPRCGQLEDAQHIWVCKDVKISTQDQCGKLLWRNCACGCYLSLQTPIFNISFFTIYALGGTM
jgi:hypothetical protein